jgi:hypothetical protein
MIYKVHALPLCDLARISEVEVQCCVTKSSQTRHVHAAHMCGGLILLLLL